MVTGITAPNGASGQDSEEFDRSAVLGLVADVGGTHVRFGIAVGGSTSSPLNVHCVRRYPVRAHESIAHAAQHYRSATPGVPASLNRAAVAVAGRVEQDRVQLTNSGWSFSARALSESQRFEHLHVINDFEAVGHAVGALRAADLQPIGSQRLALPLTRGVCAIVGVGTGLGVGGVVANGGAFTVLATEGGHASFAPTSERSIEMLRWLRRKYGRVSAERVLSGTGLANLYQALCETGGLHVPELSAAEITTRATNGSDANCVEAVGLFCELLGSFAGDLALTLGAWSGVLVSGAMLQHFDREVLERRVRAGFEYKGRFTAAMRGVALETISHPHVELLGAARLLVSSR
ncbi:MAG TPA: glucokinase [Steroidobacteraceae bacterium]|nr:glucokinase [Steroidobacteraceae bacterium]